MPEGLLGKVFGRLTVLRYTGRDHLHRHTYACACACGNTTTACRDALIVQGGKKSCGCSRRRPPTWTGCGEIGGWFWHQIERGAVARGLPFDLSIKVAWALYEAQGRRCALTGVPLMFAPTCKRAVERTASLDRIDNARGYEVGNVQWVHKDVNLMRGQITVSDFIQWCNRITRMAVQGTP